MPTTTTTTTTTSTQVSTPALSVEVRPHPRYSGYFIARIATPNCTKWINPDGVKLATVMKNVQSFLAEIRNLENNPAARMVGSLHS